MSELRAGRAVLKRALLTALILSLIVPASGCLGGSPPTSREALASLDAAVQQYHGAMGPYTSGNYSGARDEYSACVDRFKACHDQFDRIANADVPSLEKVIAGNLASAAEKYAYASAYMRDSCKDALKSGGNVYMLKVSADEFDLAARLIYDKNKANLEQYLNSQK